MLDGPTTVLFWRPSCGFCDRMLPDIKEFEAAPPADAAGLVLISTDSPEDNRAMGLKAPILLDGSFAAGSAFGAAGTPSAVLIDGEGKVASPVAVGAPDVLRLMRSGGAVAVS
jgi:thiol-disulfide isomerase/thioredoxin